MAGDMTIVSYSTNQILSIYFGINDTMERQDHT